MIKAEWTKADALDLQPTCNQLATDTINRQAAIDTRRYTFGNDEFSLEAAYHDCKFVFDGITDDDSFQEVDTGLILYYANEIIYALHEALEGKDTNVLGNDCISRHAAIKAFDCTNELIVGGEANARNVENYINKVIGKINDLPSAQPEVDCQKCIFCGFPGFKQFQTAQPENEQPTIEPERNKAWWIIHEGQDELYADMVCSSCKKHYQVAEIRAADIAKKFINTYKL